MGVDTEKSTEIRPPPAVPRTSLLGSRRSVEFFGRHLVVIRGAFGGAVLGDKGARVPEELVEPLVPDELPSRTVGAG